MSFTKYLLLPEVALFLMLVLTQSVVFFPKLQSCCGLWNQVDLQEGIVRLEPGETKNNEGRTISMAPALWQIMKDLHRNRRMDCPYVFHVKGKQLLDFLYPWNKARAAIGKPDLLFHDLRRSAIRNMLRAGVPERVAMTISGHKTRSVFDRYNIISQEDLKEAARKLEIFTASQREQLQFSYTQSRKENNVVTLKAVNL